MRASEFAKDGNVQEGPVLDKVRNWMRPSYKRQGVDSKPTPSESPLAQLSNREAKNILEKIINGQELSFDEMSTLKNVYRQL